MWALAVQNEWNDSHDDHQRLRDGPLNWHSLFQDVRSGRSHDLISEQSGWRRTERSEEKLRLSREPTRFLNIFSRPPTHCKRQPFLSVFKPSQNTESFAHTDRRRSGRASERLLQVNAASGEDARRALVASAVVPGSSAGPGLYCSIYAKMHVSNLYFEEHKKVGKKRENQRTKTFCNTMPASFSASGCRCKVVKTGKKNGSNGLHGSATLAVHVTTNSIRFQMATERTLGRKCN